MTITESEIFTSSARELATFIRNQTITARDVLEFYIKRIEKYNPDLNAVIFTDFERARTHASQIDQAIAAGEEVGPLAGVPMTIKDAFEVSGMTCEVGVPAYKGHISSADAIVVERLKRAGVVFMGKTNTPYMCADWQSFNALHGTSKNPWNLEHTPGGSSGGSAAALAAGLSALEYGSDIGGSIRVPAHFCGLFGHKPSHGLVPTRGHVPPPHGTRASGDLNVVGPLARNTADLNLLFELTRGLEPPHTAAYQLTLQGPRAQTPADLRIGVWANDPACPVSQDIQAGIEQAAQLLCAEGAQRIDIKPPFDLGEHTQVYNFLLNAVMSAQALKGGRGSAAHEDWLKMNERRIRFLDQWMDLFTQIDVLFCPVTPRTAVPHTQDPDFQSRRMIVDGIDRAYGDNIIWPGVATACGLPSTAVPLGLASDGLPFGMQIIAPPYEDQTSLAVATMLEERGHRFTMPPAYAI